MDLSDPDKSPKAAFVECPREMLAGGYVLEDTLHDGHHALFLYSDYSDGTVSASPSRSGVLVGCS